MELSENPFSLIAKSSPLLSYWLSEQDDFANQQRLAKANQESIFLNLFWNEPYKWEVLFQSVCREIIKGDKYSIRALTMLLDSINIEEREKTIEFFRENQIFTNNIIQLLASGKSFENSAKRNKIRFFLILFAIFTNPYDIELKTKRSHLYEHTGFFFLLIRRFLFR